MRALPLLIICLGCADPGGARPALDAGADAEADAARPRPACDDDPFGFTTAASPGARLAPGDQAELIVCPPDSDWVEVDAPAGQQIAAVIEADRPVRARLGAVETVAGRRVVLRGAVPPGAPALAVEAVDAAAPVPFRITLSSAVADCADALEPNDGVVEASALAGRLEAVACAGDRDLYRVEGPPGAAVTVSVERIAGQGIALASVAALGGQAIAVEEATDRVAPTLRRRLDADGQAFFRVEPDGAGARYQIIAEVEPLEVERIERSGQVRAPDRRVTPGGLEAPTSAPRAGILMDALVDGELAAVGLTDVEGAWRLAIAAPPGAAVEARARASVVVDGKLFEVGPVLGRPWAEAVDGPEIAADGALGPALHVALTAADGFSAMAPFLPQLREVPPFRVVWTPGGASACGTCYRPASDHVELSGRLTDPDEWDDAIILHELAHHLTAHHGRDDSPGGAHDGSPVAPALAWSEGFANATAAWLLGDARLLDARASGVRVVDLEVMDDPRAFGTADDTPTGAISEFLVAAVLWDALDGLDDDPLALPAEAVFQAAFSGLATRITDAGAPGMDLLDHAEALACRADPSLEALLDARGITAEVTCRDKPSSLLVPAVGGFLAGCSGWVEAGAERRQVLRGALIRATGAVRLDCGAIIEHADPQRPDRPRRWRARGGAAQLD